MALSSLSQIVMKIWIRYSKHNSISSHVEIQHFKLVTYLEIVHLSLTVYTEDSALFPAKNCRGETAFRVPWVQWTIFPCGAGSLTEECRESSQYTQKLFGMVLQKIASYGWGHVRLHSVMPTCLKLLSSVHEDKSWIFLTTASPFPVLSHLAPIPAP